MKILPALVAGVLTSVPLMAQAPGLPTSVANQLPALTETYKHLHRNPELSHHEENTSAYLAAELRKSGYAVTERVGKYQDGSQAYGIVAVMENGAGPRLADPHRHGRASRGRKDGPRLCLTVRSTNPQGQDVGVMHACGHDIHMTVLLGTAREMARESAVARHAGVHRPALRGTIDGARAMLADRLFQRFGTPDFVLSEHDDPATPAGSIALKGGPLLASSTGVYVTMRGVGGHGSAPQAGKDPIVLAAEFVLIAKPLSAVKSILSSPRF